MDEFQKINGFFGPCKTTLLPPVEASWFSPLRTFVARKEKLNRILIWHRPDGSTHEVPEGYESDGPSIPYFLAPFLPSRMVIKEAGFLHDHLLDQNYSPSWCDAEFRQAVIALKISRTYAWILYLGLRFASPFRDGLKYGWLLPVTKFFVKKRK